MKTSKIFMAATGIVCSAMMVCAAPYVMQRYRIAKPITVSQPIMTDSTGIFGKKYDASALLEGKNHFDIERLQTTFIDTDTTGLVQLNAPQEGMEIVSLQTSMRPEKFMKGNLKVVSPARFQLIVNGESKGIKSTVEDSITAASEFMVPLTLDPQRLYTVGMRVLTEKGAQASPTITATFIPDAGSDSITLAIDPELKQRVQLETTAVGPRITSTSMSPDGRYYITNYSCFYNQQHTEYWSTLSETKTGKILIPKLANHCTWLPKGAKLWYAVSTESSNDIYTLDPATMASEKWIEESPTASPIFAPDLSYFLYYESKEATIPAGPMRRYTSPDDRQPGNRDRMLVMKYDIASGISTPLFFEKEQPYVFDISGDSKKILYGVTAQHPEEYPFYQAEVILLDIQTLKTDTIFKKEGAFNSAMLSPKADKVFVMGGPSFQNGVGISGLTADEPIPNDFDAQGYIIDVATKKITPCTKDFDPSLSGPITWNKADGNIYFRGEHGFYASIYQLNPNTLKITELPSEIDLIANFSMGEYEPNYISYMGQGFTYAGKGYMLNTKTGKSSLIDDPLGKSLAKVEMGKVNKWSFKSTDGTEIDGIYVTPADFDPNKKYPMIVYYYGGTSPSTASLMHPYSSQLLSSRGYVVYILNPSGTYGYGQEFAARHVNAWGKYTANDIITGVKEFCRQHPFVNADKIGCMGASYGGFMTQYLLTQTDIFACGISHAGISNVTSYWGEGYWGYSYNAVAAAKSYPWSDPELFTKQGSLFNADKIHTPLLLLHGTVDTNVPIGESIQIFTALKLLNRDVEFVTVDNENHFISDFNKRKLWHATIMAWFSKWLQDDSRWWNELYPNE